MQKTNKIIVHAAGGAGINIADKVMTAVSELGSGFSNIEFLYIDTSRSNIDKITPRGDFWMVKTKSHAGAVIDGSGSERIKNANDIAANIKEYLDNHKITKLETGVYHMVIFSASGGSGSVAGPLLVKNLLELGIPVISVVIGDSSNGLSAMNTKDTLASLSSISNITKRALSIVYINNHALAEGNRDGMIGAERAANKQLLNTLSTISLFLSNVHEALDDADMRNIIDQSNYTKIKIPHGLYGIGIYSKDIVLPTGSVPTIGRSLSIDEVPADTSLTLMHHKKGKVIDANAIDIYQEQFPLHMVAFANYFTLEEKALSNVTNGYTDIMNSIVNDEIQGTKDSHTDENGLIF